MVSTPFLLENASQFKVYMFQLLLKADLKTTVRHIFTTF